MSRHVLDARELKDGEIFDAGETLRMRISKIYRIRHECAARAVRNTSTHIWISRRIACSQSSSSLKNHDMLLADSTVRPSAPTFTYPLSG